MEDPLDEAAELAERLLEKGRPERAALENELQRLIYQEADSNRITVGYSPKANLCYVSPSHEPVIDDIVFDRCWYESDEVVLRLEVTASIDVNYQLEHEGEVWDETVGTNLQVFVRTDQALSHPTLEDGEWSDEIEDHYEPCD